jgi:hypothetical protein
VKINEELLEREVAAHVGEDRPVLNENMLQVDIHVFIGKSLKRLNLC